MGSIDISIPSVLEIEAPLGGTSVEYKISIATNLPFYKENEDLDSDIQFSVQKALREIEDFYEKINKKFRNANLPPIPKGRLRLTTSNEEKRIALHTFMQHISKNENIYNSQLFQSFINFDRIRNKIKKDKASQIDSEDPLSDKISTVETEDNISNDDTDSIVVIGGLKNDEPLKKKSEDLSKLFPKMKVKKTESYEEIDSFNSNDALFTSNKILNLDLDEEDLDLFEEVKQIKVKNKEISEKDSNNELFSESPISNVLSSETVQTERDTSAVNNKKIEAFEAKEKIEKRSSILFGGDVQLLESEKHKKTLFSSDEMFGGDKKQSNLGKFSLFEEQDFGSSITKEDQELFFIPEQEIKFSESNNPILSPISDSTDDQDDSLEDLVQVEYPIHVPKIPKESSAEVARKPVPLPRAKPPLGPDALDATSGPKPQVAPRKVVLSKPTPPAKPEIIKPKPVPPPKPKKPTPRSSEDTNLQEDSSNGDRKEEKFISDLNSMDIMQYIEQEEKASVLGANLFD